MSKLTDYLSGNHAFLASIEECRKRVNLVLQRYLQIHPEFTDHSIVHSETVLDRASDVLGKNIKSLNQSEIYILIMSCYLHDIGMVPTKEMKKQILKETIKYPEYIRENHHKLSSSYILDNYKSLGIIDQRYAEAMATVSMGHRQEELLDPEVFKPNFFVKSGSETVCISFLSAILRLSDELDITHERIPDLIYNQYFPDNRISKTEWEKHKSNLQVNFLNDKIIIRGSCDNYDIYSSLIDHYKKIKEVLMYVRRVASCTPYDRNLKIDFTTLETDLKTLGFIPKNIGFSFDLKNTLDTFIGKNIYSTGYVAIREVVQNSIDSCAYKKIIIPDYSPQIQIVLENHRLIVTDNGLGMNEFIVETYFSCLARSYYVQEKFKIKFESISQFGIGVFSYFLLCDYFEVETRKQGEPPLKFKVTRDANAYFKFSDDILSVQEGTKITFFLNEKLAFSELCNQVEHFFRFVDIPIKIKTKKREEIVKRQTFDKPLLSDIKQMVNVLYSAESNNITFVSNHLETNEYEGICSLLIYKDRETKYSPTSLYKVVDDTSINLSQKGIYVGEYQGHLRNIIGKINLKKKNDLVLSRSHLSNDKLVSSILSDFESGLIDQIFKQWKKLSSKNKSILTKRFISTYLVGHKSYIPTKLIDAYLNHFTVMYYHNGKFNFAPFKQFLALNTFLIVRHCEYWNWAREERPENESYKKVWGKYKIPLLVVDDGFDDEFYLNLLEKKGYQLSVEVYSENWFYRVRTNKGSLNENINEIGRIKILPISNKEISAYPNITTDVIGNLENPIINYLVKNKDSILENQLLFNLWKDFIDLLHDFMFNLHVGGIKKPWRYIDSMNKLLYGINNISKTSFSLTKNDFSPWIKKKLSEFVSEI